jgi:hypothetical protein
VDPRNNADVIAGSDPSVVANDALKLSLLSDWKQFDRAVVLSIGIVPVEFAKFNVMVVQQRSGWNFAGSKANDSVVLENGFAFADSGGGNLVTSRHMAPHRKVFGRNRGVTLYIASGNQNVVTRMQTEDRTGNALDWCHVIILAGGLIQTKCQL